MRPSKRRDLSRPQTDQEIEVKRRARALAVDFESLFNSDPGKRVMEHLAATFADASIFPSEAQDGMSLALRAARRDGMREVVMYVMDMVREGGSFRLEDERAQVLTKKESE